MNFARDAGSQAAASAALGESTQRRGKKPAALPHPEPRATSCKRMPQRRYHAYGRSNANDAAAPLNGQSPTEGPGHETGTTRPVHMRSVAPELPTGSSCSPSPALRSRHRWTADAPNSEPTRTPDLEPQATSHEQIPRQRHHAYGCPNDTDAVAAVNSQPPTEPGVKTRTTAQGSNAVHRPDCPAESNAVRRPHSSPNTANRRRRQTGTDATPSLEAGSTTLERTPREETPSMRLPNAVTPYSQCVENGCGVHARRRHAARTPPARRRHAARTPPARRPHAARTPTAKGTHQACGMQAARRQPDRTVHAACSAAVRTMKAARSRGGRRRILPRAHTDQPKQRTMRATRQNQVPHEAQGPEGCPPS